MQNWLLHPQKCTLLLYVFNSAYLAEKGVDVGCVSKTSMKRSKLLCTVPILKVLNAAHWNDGKMS